MFANPLDDLSAYTVTIAQQPVSPVQVCSIAHASGTVDGSDVNTVVVTCTTPLPDLRVNVGNNHDYLRYGMLTNYLVTVTNEGTGDASAISIKNLSPPQLDGAFTTWRCFGSGDGATCGSGVGALDDTGVSIPIGRSLTWLVTSPVRIDAPGDTVDYTVDVSGQTTASATDSDRLVILRTGFDVPYGDGAESAIEASMDACALAPSCAALDRFDLAATYTVTLSTAGACSPIGTVLLARDSHASGFRIERLHLDVIPQIRLVTIDRDIPERASDWTAAPDGTLLVIATVRVNGGSVVLVEGAGVSLRMPLPKGLGGTVSVWEPTADCE